MAMIQPDYNLVHLLCIIFSQGISQHSPSCQKFTNTLMNRARSRGYRGNLIPVFKDDRSTAEELVKETCDLAYYICVNDLREMFISNPEHTRFTAMDSSSMDSSFQTVPAGRSIH